MTNNLLGAQFWLSNIYGVFIGVIWPVYAPFSVYSAEINAIRRKIIALVIIVGVGLAMYTLIGLASQPITAKIVNHSIHYEHDVTAYQFVIVMYLLATCVPFIFSSYRHIYIAGFVITSGFFYGLFCLS